jgi:hypothetical protein
MTRHLSEFRSIDSGVLLDMSTPLALFKTSEFTGHTFAEGLYTLVLSWIDPICQFCFQI